MVLAGQLGMKREENTDCGIKGTASKWCQDGAYMAPHVSELCQISSCRFWCIGGNVERLPMTTAPRSQDS